MTSLIIAVLSFVAGVLVESLRRGYREKQLCQEAYRTGQEEATAECVERLVELFEPEEDLRDRLESSIIAAASPTTVTFITSTPRDDSHN